MHPAPRARWFFCVALPVALGPIGCAGTEKVGKTEQAPEIPDHALPTLESPDKGYHTPLAVKLRLFVRPEEAS